MRPFPPDVGYWKLQREAVDQYLYEQETEILLGRIDYSRIAVKL